MRKIVIAVMGTISGLVLLFSYHTSTNAEATIGTGAGEQDAGAGTASTDPTAPSATASSGTSTSGSYTGDAVQTKWGEVQVQITVKAGKITAADAVEYPNGNGRDQEINTYAIPQLNAEVVAAQSAKIDAVSGATVTSDGYISSLQSAIDAAHL